MLTLETGLQPVPSLSTCLSAQPGSSLLAVMASGHQVALLQLRVHASKASDAVDDGTAASTDSDSSSSPSVLEAEAVLRLGFGAGNDVCCAAWDASGDWLAVGTTQQLHLFHRQAGSGNVVPMGSTQLRFTPKVWAIPPKTRRAGSSSDLGNVPCCAGLNVTACSEELVRDDFVHRCRTSACAGGHSTMQSSWQWVVLSALLCSRQSPRYAMQVRRAMNLLSSALSGY